MKKLLVPAFIILVLGLAFFDLSKRREMEAEESRRFVEQVNAQEEQFDAELQIHIERNRKLDEQQARLKNIP